MAKAKRNSGIEKLTPILILVSIGLAFAVGVLWQKVSNLEGGKPTNVAQAPSQAAQPQQPQGPTQGKLSDDQAAKVPEVTSNDHIRGNVNAEITLVEYSDLECPFCSRFHPTTMQVLEEYGDEVRLVFRHFPLDSIHAKARPGAIASECVADLGGEDAFWNYLDEIFENQTTALSDLGGTAATIGLSSTSVQNCIDSEKFAEKVEDQYQGGLGAGITGTPGNFIVNSKGETWLVPGALPLEQLKLTIDEALQS